MLSDFANRVLDNRTKKLVKFYRMRAFERLGSRRYSRPAWNELDRKLTRYLDYRGGVFIECGANDGYTQSNTYYLQRFRGWTGLLIEPVPMLAELCRRFRAGATVVNCALGATDGTSIELVYSDLMTIARGALGSVEDERAHARSNQPYTSRDGNFPLQAPLRRLSSVLDEHGLSRVDFFSLDVEGFELHVLRGLDTERHDIRYLLVETMDPNAVLAALGSSYELVDQLSHHDYLFARTRAAGVASISV